MTDRYDQDMILGYVEGELDDAQRATFEATLEQDHELRNLVSQMKLDRESLRNLGVTPAPIGLIDQVIQAQERAELLGDPEAPEPLPLAMPVHSHKFHRVMVYSGIAAVLLLSAALIGPTLMPSGLLDRSTQYSQNKSLAPDVGSGLALADEDGEYDKTSEVPIAGLQGGDGRAMKKAAMADTTEPVDEKIDPPVTALADMSPSSAGEIAEEPSLPTDPALVLDEPEKALDVVVAEADLAEETKASEQDATSGTEETESALVKVESIEKQDEVVPTGPALAAADEVEPKRVAAAIHDPFMGYDNDDAPALTSQTQLLVNTSSPTLARRDIQNWAISNSVRVVEDPAAASIHRRAIAGGGAGGPITQTQLIVEIDQEQVPELLVYLNRIPSQQAELITMADADTPTGEAGSEGERLASRAETRRVRDAGHDDPPKALANRPTEIRSNWPGTGTGMVSGLAPTKPTRDKNEKHTDTPSSESVDESLTVNEQQPKDTSTTPEPFDWGNIFDSLTIQPAKPPAPLLQPEPRERLRLEVVIQQVADEVPVNPIDPE